MPTIVEYSTFSATRPSPGIISNAMSSNIGGGSQSITGSSVFHNSNITGNATLQDDIIEKSTTNTNSQSTENTKEKTSNNTGLIIIFIILGMAAAGGVGYYFYKRRSTSP
jgi:hypothetical protein